MNDARQLALGGPVQNPGAFAAHEVSVGHVRHPRPCRVRLSPIYASPHPSLDPGSSTTSLLWIKTLVPH
jgi:hypothetical protein